MTAKDKIDSFIGFYPDVLKTVYNNPNYAVYKNMAQNNAYWTGYIKAKTEIRNKLYIKEQIAIPEEQTLYFPDENMSINMEIYERL